MPIDDDLLGGGWRWGRGVCCRCHKNVLVEVRDARILYPIKFLSRSVFSFYLVDFCTYLQCSTVLSRNLFLFPLLPHPHKLPVSHPRLLHSKLFSNFRPFCTQYVCTNSPSFAPYQFRLSWTCVRDSNVSRTS